METADGRPVREEPLEAFPLPRAARALLHGAIDGILDAHPEAERTLESAVEFLDTKGVDILTGLKTALGVAQAISSTRPLSG